MFSVVIATCNRPDRLVLALEAVRVAVARTGGEHEVVVADNGSQRAAQDAVKRFAAAVPFSTRYVRSEPCSKAAALNAGITAARGDWLAFTDDDCLPSAPWLSEAAGFAEGGDFPVFTGKIVSGPVDFKLPRWLPEGVTGELPWTPAFFDYPPQTEGGALQAGTTLPYGANLFVQRAVFAGHGGYDEDLWKRCGRAALGSEDAEFAIRIRDQGVPIGFCRNAVVVHPVYPERTTLRYYLRHVYNSGIREPFFSDPRTQASTRYLLKALLLSLLKSSGRLLRNQPIACVRELMSATRDLGELVGWRRIRKHSPPSRNET